jgi:plastocyanin
MTTRKQVKKQHRLEREAQLRAAERARTQRLVLGVGAGAVFIAGAIALLLVVAPWSSSEATPENLPTITLTMGDNYFRPEPLIIKATQKYRLNLPNEGVAVHDAWFAGPDGKTDTGDDIRTEPIPGGGSATEEIKFDNPGTYYFVCTFHGGMGGTLIVEEPATPEVSPQ